MVEADIAHKFRLPSLVKLLIYFLVLFELK